MGPLAATATVFVRYFDFKGRSCRSELFGFKSCDTVMLVVLTIFDVQNFWARVEVQPDLVENLAKGTGFEIVLSFMVFWYFIFTFLPRTFVQIRRLHDAGLSSLHWFITFVPVIGSIVLYAMMFLPSQKGNNAYGPSPITGDDTTLVLPDGTMLDRKKGIRYTADKSVRITQSHTAAWEERRKAEIHNLYQSRVLKQSSQA